MKNKNAAKKFLLVIGLPVFFVVGMALRAYAITPSITANPISGESEISFRVTPGLVSTPVEVRVKTQNTTAKYEVRQEILSPLSSGAHDIDWRSVTMRGLQGSNAYGTFSAASGSAQPFMSLNPLYTNLSGTPDQFVLIYYANVPLGSAEGSYRGRLRLLLTPLDQSQSQVYCMVNIVVNVGRSQSQDAGAVPLVEVTPVTGVSTIMLNSKNESKQGFDVAVKINGRFASMFSILQVISTPFVSSDGMQMPLDALTVQAREVSKGMGIAKLPLGQQQTLYSSMPGGDSASEFLLTYALGDLTGKKAGKYRGRIQYYLEQEGKPVLMKTLECEVEIERIFDMAISPKDQKNVLEFRNLKPKDQPKKNEILVTVASNVGRPYQVTQKIYTDLTSTDGHTIPSKYFTIRTESISTKGGLKFPEKGEVRKGDTVLFISDAQGSSDSFRLIYELSSAPEVIEGNYNTRLVYSLSEI